MGSRLQVDKRREQLLELGLELFADRSYEDISITEIARLAGISKGLLYHYFGGKRAFYTATIQAAADRLVAAITADSSDTSMPGPQRALAGLLAYLNFVEAHARSYAALMHGGLGSDADTHPILESARSKIIGQLLAGLGLTSERPIFRMAARSWLGAVEAASLEWLERRDISRAELLALLQTSLYYAMLTASQLDPDAGVVLAHPPPSVEGR